LLRLLRHGRVRLALCTTLALFALPAAAAQADLVQGAPTNVRAGFFDDHSIGGDNHMGWGNGDSDSEPLAITFGTTLTNTFSGPFQVCGYGSGGWRRAYEIPGISCPSAPTGDPVGWFRYVIANHDNPDRDLFNRWHLMDLQRFALVPLAGPNGPAAPRWTAWDTFWGTCLSAGTPTMDCPMAEGATTVASRIDPGVTKTTQEANPAPDAQRIAIPAEARMAFPDGYYQVVAIANPYGRFSGPPTVACTTIHLTGMAAYAPQATQVGGTPATCYVPTNPPAPLAGPGGRDPMADAMDSDCDLLPTTLHCWAEVPTSGAYPIARTNVTADNALTPTSTVPVAQAGGVQNLPAPAPGASNPPATASGQSHAPRPRSARLTTRAARGYARRALRKQFGRKLSRLKVSCRLRSTSASTCKVSFRKSRASYRGNVWLRLRTTSSRVRWQYRMEIKKTQRGHKTRTIKRSYRTGGSL